MGFRKFQRAKSVAQTHTAIEEWKTHSILYVKPPKDQVYLLSSGFPEHPFFFWGGGDFLLFGQHLHNSLYDVVVGEPHSQQASIHQTPSVNGTIIFKTKLQQDNPNNSS